MAQEGEIHNLQDIANILRRDVLEMTTEAGSGHASSCLSCAEIISCLFFKEMRYDISNPLNSDNDEFVLSKGHAAPILYSALYRASAIAYYLKGLRTLNSPLEGHPIPSSLNWVKVATGSLGQGLSAALGIALSSRMQKRKYMTYVLLGDSELAEGSIWEAVQFASFYEINNFIVIADINRLGQRGETMLGYKTKEYRKRFESFGWHVLEINGHDIKQILEALEKAKKSKAPTIILAKTVKGKGVSFMEDKNGWHGKALSKEELQKALKKIPSPTFPQLHINLPEKSSPILVLTKSPKLSNYKPSEYVSTREAYGNILANLAQADSNILALDAEVSNSTFSEKVKSTRSKQFIECFIMEQNMLSVALGLSVKGFNVFASTFSAFLTRAHDQIRMSALSSANMTICGSHSGVSIGEDGPSQMGLEDISLFRTLPNSIIFYPSDAVSAEKLVLLASQTKGLKYIRTTRPATPILYKPEDKFELGDFKVLRESPNDALVLAGSGITVHESIKASDELQKQGIPTSVVDLFCIKPFNTVKFIEFVKSHGSKLIISEDHYKEGGIGEMLSSELINSGIQIISLSVLQMPHSGKKEELLEKYGINAKSIMVEAKKNVSSELLLSLPEESQKPKKIKSRAKGPKLLSAKKEKPKKKAKKK